VKTFHQESLANEEVGLPVIRLAGFVKEENYNSVSGHAKTLLGSTQKNTQEDSR
jgi:hypothetical protein